MTSIYLIRHGQASFGEANYDRLSTLGIEQAKTLGKHWHAESNNSLIVTGELERQIHTSAHFTCFANIDAQSNIVAGFNEFDHKDILLNGEHNWQSLEQISQHYQNKSASKNIVDNEQALRELAKTFHKATLRWTSGKHCGDYNESWSEFKTRAISALDQVATQLAAKDESVDNALVFTSGGVISVIVQHLLGISDEQCLKLMNQIRNTSVSKLDLKKSGLTLDYFNNYQHLQNTDSRLLTFVKKKR